MDNIQPITPAQPFNSSPTSSSMFDNIKNVNFTTWIIIIFILAFLGFNVFAYLAKGTQDITNIFAPIMKKIFGSAAVATGQVIDVSAEGAKAVVSKTANVIEKGLTTVQEITPNPNHTFNPSVSKTSVKSHSIEQPPSDNIHNTQLGVSLNHPDHANPNDYEADIASSSIQGIGKSGWCYIGEDRGFRSCAQVGVNDSCISGDIFPTKDICMNPSLRQ